MMQQFKGRFGSISGPVSSGFYTLLSVLMPEYRKKVLAHISLADSPAEIQENMWTAVLMYSALFDQWKHIFKNNNYVLDIAL